MDQNKNVYLDNDALCAIVKEDMQPMENAALKRLFELFEQGKLRLRTSKVHEKEIDNYEGPYKPEIEELCRKLKKVPFVEDHELHGFHSQWDARGGVSVPLVSDHPVSRKLREIGLDREDAHHLMLAIAACDVFLTCDRRDRRGHHGILKRASDIEAEFPIRVMGPSEFVHNLDLRC